MAEIIGLVVFRIDDMKMFFSNVDVSWLFAYLGVVSIVFRIH